MTASTSKPRRWLQPRFSLAALLLFMTVVAVAVWVWTWPYEEVTTFPTRVGQDKLVTTWRRTLTGGRVKHGPERMTTDRFERLQHYRDGQLHGPYVFKHAGGSETKGQYDEGEREGTWTTTHSDLTQTAEWHDGQLDGTLEIRLKNGDRQRYTFSQDRLIDDDGKPLLSVDGKGMPAMDASALLSCDFVNTPLEDVVAYLAEVHQAPAKLDPRVPRGERNVTQPMYDIGLLHVLQILAQKHDLTCHIHDGAIWLEPSETGS